MYGGRERSGVAPPLPTDSEVARNYENSHFDDIHFGMFSYFNFF